MNDDEVHLPRVGLLFRWAATPESWSIVEDDISPGGRGDGEEGEAADCPALRVVAGARTDLFVDPLGEAPVLNAPRLLGVPVGDFQLSARVDVEFVSDFDAGVLLLWADTTSWAKLCFERSPQGQPMVVSVVNRNVSDDANACDVDGRAVWLRISRIGSSYGFHASTDGQLWRFVRHFTLDPPAGAEVQVGFEAQSPTGDGCSATFSKVVYLEKRLADLRSGV
jgi:regulation of enolase protein 1 (concanavalin A-like superfamily)